MRIPGRQGATTLAVAALLLVGGTAAAQTEWIYIARGTEFAAVNPASGERVGGGTLLPASLASQKVDTSAVRSSPTIVPTPGGRYVFFYFDEADLAIVVDAETHEVARAVELPAGSTRIQFSSMGDALYVERSDGRVSLSHRRGDVSGSPSPAPELDPGRIAFNRRATRVYGERDGRLIYALTRDGSELTSVRLRGGPYDWQMSPNFRYLLGTSRDGSGMVLVDEARARVVGYLDEPFLENSVTFDDGSREVLFVTGDGSRVVGADVRRFRASSGEDLAVDLSSAWRDSDGSWHGVSSNGDELILDATDSARRVPVGSFLTGRGSAAGSLVTLKPGQGFACF